MFDENGTSGGNLSQTYNCNSIGQNIYGPLNTSIPTGRIDTVTRGKRKGIKYIIKVL